MLVQKGKRGIRITFLLALFLAAGSSYAAERTPLWDRMCQACHDGQTVLNGKVVIDKEQIKARYRSIEALVNAVSCKAPPCMNILKHDEKLVRRTGKEIGIRE